VDRPCGRNTPLFVEAETVKQAGRHLEESSWRLKDLERQINQIVDSIRLMTADPWVGRAGLT
jgi:hypothetical protein